MMATFQRVWDDFSHLPKSALFKTMGYSPGFLLKIGRFRTLANSHGIFTNKPKNSQKSICKHAGDVSECLGRFLKLTKIRPLQNHGLQPRLFAQNRSISDPCEFSRNLQEQAQKQLEIHLQACRRRFREFGTISQTYQNPPSSKPWAIAQAFCSKSVDFGHLRILTESLGTSPKTVRNPFASMQATFQRVWDDFSHLPKSALFKTMGYSPGFLLKIGRFRTLANSHGIFRNKPKNSQKSICKHEGDVSESLDDFSHLPKSALFKTMGYSPGFLLKIGRFRTLANSHGIFTNKPKNSQKSICKHAGDVSESLGRFLALTKIRPLQNHGLQPRLFAQNRSISDTCEFSRNLYQQAQKQLEIHFQACRATFQRVWDDFSHLPKSALFKTMGYSPGFLLKIGRFRTLANSHGIFTNMPKNSQKSTFKHAGDVSESLGRFLALTKIRPLQNHGLQPRLFAQNRSISDPCEFSRNLYKQAQKQLEIHLQACRRRFREFGTISRTYQNPPSSKPWAIAQAFCSKSVDFGHLRILTESLGTSPKTVRNPFASMQATFQRVWDDFSHLPKSALFKTMGYSPGFLLKIGRFRTLANSHGIFTNMLKNSWKSTFKHAGDVSESLGRFLALTKIRPLQNHGLQPRLFAQNRSISDTCEFSRNLYQQAQKQLEIHFQACRRRFREFGTISRTYQNPPSSKPWAIAQAFCSKSVDFGHLRILTESLPTQKQLEINFQACRRRFREFGTISRTYQNPPFKTMGYSPGFLLKIGRFRTLANSHGIFTNMLKNSEKSTFKHAGDVSESLGRFLALTKIRPLQNHGLQPRLFAQNRSISDTCEFSRNLYKQAQKQSEIHLQACRRRFRKFGTISRTYQNPPSSKPWAIAQAFCSKSVDFGHLRILTESLQTSPKTVRNPFASMQATFQRVWDDFSNLPKSALFKTMGYSPGFLLKMGRFRTLANSHGIFTNKPQKQLEIHFQACRRRFREFGTISQTYQNPPSSKPWAIAQAFCSKSVDFGHLRILTESLPTCSKIVGNPLSSMQATFQRVWDDFSNLPKSALFKTMGYSPGFLLKIGRFRTLANSHGIFTNKPKNSQKSICKHAGDVSESLGRFLELTKIRPLQNHGLQPRLFAQNRSISDPCEFSRNLYKKPKNSQKSICKHAGDVSESLGRFLALTKIRRLQNHGLQPRLFAQNGSISDTCEFSRNLYQHAQKQFEIHFQV